MRKLKKLFNKPHIFLRDALNNKYPIIHNEQGISENNERLVIKLQESLDEIDTNICVSDDPVDVVFTWVDNTDPAWLSKKNIAIPNDNVANFATDIARFENHNELYYSVYSVKKFLPWVRKIFIVTDSQIPNWLDPTDPKIIIIDHKEIISEEFLPTFNSHVIEANLHKIPDLSEHFIYFNDDVFVARPLKRSHFFRNNNIASLFLTIKNLKLMRSRAVETPTLMASVNSLRLLNRHFGEKISINSPLVHSYIPLRKSEYIYVWQHFEKEIIQFLGNKFRGKNDLNLATFLVPYSLYLRGKSVVTTEICYYFNIRSPNALTQYKALLNGKKSSILPHSFCANDFNSEKSIPDYAKKLEHTLKNFYK